MPRLPDLWATVLPCMASLCVGDSEAGASILSVRMMVCHLPGKTTLP